MIKWLKSRLAGKTETRAAGMGFTSEIMAAREAYIAGRSGIGELTATVQSCIGLWESGLSIADVTGSDLLDARTLALTARSLALRGEAVFVIGDDRLTPVADWDLSTRGGEPFAYRVSVSEAGGGTTRTALAQEVVHVRIGSDPVAPWTGTAPLRRASLTAGLLNTLEVALSEVYEFAPLASSVVPFPETPDTDLEKIGRNFRGRRGRVLLRESVSTTAAGGPVPSTDWKPQSVSPDMQKSMANETLDRTRAAISMAFGVLPAFHASAATGPVIREAQRHLAQWMLQPVATVLAEEVSAKTGENVTIDTMRPLQAYDQGGRARALATVVKALAEAKEAGIDPGPALALVDWNE